MEMTFKTGEFVELRALRKIHLGEKQIDIKEESQILFDGNTVKLDGVDYLISGSIRAAIRANWLVPKEDSTSVYQTNSANVTMRPAQGKGEAQVMNAKALSPDEQDLGNLKSVRNRGDGVVRKVSHQEDEGGEGVPVGRVLSPAVQKTEVSAATSQRLLQKINQMDNTQGAGARLVEPLSKTASVTMTGDVQEARSADSLEELLGESVISTKAPNAGPAGEGTEPHLTAEEKAQAARKARMASMGEATAPTAPTPVAEPVPELNLAKIALVRAAIPDFQWDLSRQWKARVKDAVDNYKSNPLYLHGIMAVETDSVKSHITKLLSK